MYELKKNELLHDVVSEMVMVLTKVLVHMHTTGLRRFQSLISQDGNVSQKSKMSHSYSSCFVEHYPGGGGHLNVT